MSLSCIDHTKNALEYVLSSLPVVGSIAIKLRLNLWEDLAIAILENKTLAQVPHLSDQDKKIFEGLNNPQFELAWRNNQKADIVIIYRKIAVCGSVQGFLSLILAVVFMVLKNTPPSYICGSLLGAWGVVHLIWGVRTIHRVNSYLEKL